jgi:hypothetical protein
LKKKKKNEWQECKTGTIWELGPDGERRARREGEWKMNMVDILYMYGNRTMKPIKINFKRKEGGWERVMGEEFDQSTFIHKYGKDHNEVPLCN